MKPPTDHQRFRHLLERLGYSQRSLARTLGMQEGATRGMARGREPIPPDVLAWLEHCVQTMPNRPGQHRT